MEVQENSKENRNPSEPKMADAPGSSRKSNIKGRKMAAAKPRTRAGTKSGTPFIPAETPKLSLFRNAESAQYNISSGAATPTRSSSQPTGTLDSDLVFKSLDDLSNSDGDAETLVSAKNIEESTQKF